MKHCYCTCECSVFVLVKLSKEIDYQTYTRMATSLISVIFVKPEPKSANLLQNLD